MPDLRDGTLVFSGARAQVMLSDAELYAVQRRLDAGTSVWRISLGEPP